MLHRYALAQTLILICGGTALPETNNFHHAAELEKIQNICPGFQIVDRLRRLRTFLRKNIEKTLGKRVGKFVGIDVMGQRYQLPIRARPEGITY